MTFKGTTILAIKGRTSVAIGGDGQVSLGDTVMKKNAVKVRKIYKSQIVAGFAGSTADAFTLFELLEEQLEKTHGQLMKSAVELARSWRSDKILRRLEAMLVAANAHNIVIVSGSGDVIAPEDGIAAIGSGGSYAYAAARALTQNTTLSTHEMVEKSLTIAADMCVYTNHAFTIEELHG